MQVQFRNVWVLVSIAHPFNGTLTFKKSFATCQTLRLKFQTRKVHQETYFDCFDMKCLPCRSAHYDQIDIYAASCLLKLLNACEVYSTSTRKLKKINRTNIVRKRFFLNFQNIWRHSLFLRHPRHFHSLRSPSPAFQSSTPWQWPNLLQWLSW